MVSDCPGTQDDLFAWTKYTDNRIVRTERRPDGSHAYYIRRGRARHLTPNAVLDLRGQGKEVFVVTEAVGSRRPSDKELALARMRSHGVHIVSREMVAFEWLGQAGSDEFREISREFLK